MKYVAYYRVSTGKQDICMPAQKSAVRRCLSGTEPVKSFIEVESGGKNGRPELQKALAYCKAQKATLVVAKLDRLSRSVAFIADLQESADIDFICADMPQATRETIGFLAVIARWEREQIGKRTREALAERRKAGVLLGSANPVVKAGLDRYRAGMRAEWASRRKAREQQGRGLCALAKADMAVLPTIRALRKQGMSYRAIAKALNEGGFKGRRGGVWGAVQVGRVWRRRPSDPAGGEKENRSGICTD